MESGGRSFDLEAKGNLVSANGGGSFPEAVDRRGRGGVEERGSKHEWACKQGEDGEALPGRDFHGRLDSFFGCEWGDAGGGTFKDQSAEHASALASLGAATATTEVGKRVHISI